MSFQADFLTSRGLSVLICKLEEIEPSHLVVGRIKLAPSTDLVHWKCWDGLGGGGRGGDILEAGSRDPRSVRSKMTFESVHTMFWPEVGQFLGCTWCLTVGL